MDFLITFEVDLAMEEVGTEEHQEEEECVGLLLQACAAQRAFKLITQETE